MEIVFVCVFVLMRLPIKSKKGRIALIGWQGITKKSRRRRRRRMIT